MNAVQQIQALANEVVGAAAAAPEAADAIYANAATKFREFARRKENARMAAALATVANEFEALAMALRQSRQGGPATVNDFIELEQEHAQAHAEVGHFDDLEIKARRNDIHESNVLRRQDAKRVLFVPESVDRSIIGLQAKVKFNPTQDDIINNIRAEQTVLLWQDKKVQSQAFTIDIDVIDFNTRAGGANTTVAPGQTGNAVAAGPLAVLSTAGFAPSGSLLVQTFGGLTPFEAATYTGILGNTFTGMASTAVGTLFTGGLVTQDAQPTSFRPFARIQIGADGYVGFPINVDVGMGLRVTGAGNYVSVIVGMDVPAAANFSATATIGSRMGFFAAPSVQPVSRTSYIDGLAPGIPSAVRIARPIRAQQLGLVQMSDLAGSVQLNFIDSAGTVIYRRAFANGAMVTAITLGGDEYFIDVINTGALAQSIRLPWLLSL